MERSLEVAWKVDVWIEKGVTRTREHHEGCAAVWRKGNGGCAVLGGGTCS
jgi:hypothetical protein